MYLLYHYQFSGDGVSRIMMMHSVCGVPTTYRVLNSIIKMQCRNALKCIFNNNKNCTETILVLLYWVFIHSIDVLYRHDSIYDRFYILIKLKYVKIVNTYSVIRMYSFKFGHELSKYSIKKQLLIVYQYLLKIDQC